MMSQVSREDGEGLGVNGRGVPSEGVYNWEIRRATWGFCEPCMGESEVTDIPCGGPVAIVAGRRSIAKSVWPVGASLSSRP